MIYKYKLIKENGKDILYLYFDDKYEFSKSFSDKSSKNYNFKKNVSNYIKRKNIPFKKGKIVLIVGGLLMGSIMFNNNSTNYKNSSVLDMTIFGANLNELSANRLYAKQADNTTHTVQPGETLNSIAKKYNLTVPELRALNNLTNNHIKIGQVLNIKKITINLEITTKSETPTVVEEIVTSNVTSPEVKDLTYTTQKGDTITSIAKKYNLTVKELKTINNLTNNTLKIGQVLNVSNSTIKSEIPDTSTAKASNPQTPSVSVTPTTPTTPETPKTSNPEENTNTSSKNTITIYRSTGVILQIELEDYIIGVLAAEMPASFSVEALKAQALIARTYALRKISRKEILTDTVSTQSFIDVDQMKNKWGSSFNTYYNKISNAVKSTSSEYITYNGSYIEAVYHSTSNGYTEDAVNVWGNSVPYLKSVSSPWDQNASSYLRTETKEFDTLAKILGFQINDNTSIEVLSKNSSGRISSIKIEGNIYTGVGLRTLLGLRSADFDIEITNGKAKFITRGYGHGVGMSQYGANGMANEGYNYKEIINHYYTGVKISKI